MFTGCSGNHATYVPYNSANWATKLEKRCTDQGGDVNLFASKYYVHNKWNWDDANHFYSYDHGVSVVCNLKDNSTATYTFEGGSGSGSYDTTTGEND